MQPLDRGLNTAILHIASRLFPCGFDVSTDTPDSCEALRAHLDSGRRMIVWSGGSDSTIYGDRDVNYAFRAWHDFCHWRGNHGYSLAGEIATWVMQRDHLIHLYGDQSRTRRWTGLLAAEIVGQSRYFQRFKRFPENQRGFVTAYVADADAALLRSNW